MWKLKLIDSDTNTVRAELEAPLLECLSAWKSWRALLYSRVELWEGDTQHDPREVWDGMARLFAPVEA